MKKISFFVVAAALMSMVATSCQKDSLDEGQDVAVAEQFLDDEDGKTFFLNSKLYWKKGDNVQIYQYNPSYNMEYKNTLTDDQYSQNVTLIPSDASRTAYNNTQKLYGLYPSFYFKPKTNASAYDFVYNTVDYDEDDDIDDPIFVVDLPAQQVLDNDVNPLNRLHLTRFPRAAKRAVGVTKYDFNNLCGILKLTIKGDTPIEEIAFKADEVSNGAFELTWVNNSAVASGFEPFLTPVNSPSFENTTTKLQFHTPVSVTNSQDFFIALPQPIKRDNEAYPYYHNVTITITNSNYETTVLNFNTLRIRRNVITTITRNGKDETHPEINQDDYTRSNGIFTTAIDANRNSTHKVYIAPGNLQYRSTNWQFANQQYEVLHGQTYSPDNYGTEGNEWDLFGWSVTTSNYGRSTTSSDYSWTGYNYGGEPVHGPYYSSPDVPSNPFVDYGAVLGNPEWYTLSIFGWRVLLQERRTSFTVGTTNNVRCAPIGIVDHYGPEERNGVQMPHYICGLLIFPDDFSASDWPAGVPTLNGKIINSAPNKFPQWDNENGCLTMTKEQFKRLEAQGVIFLPCTGKSAINQNSVTANGEYDCSLYYQTSTVAYTTTGHTNVDWLGETNVNWISDNTTFQLYCQNGSFNLYNMQGQNSTDQCAVRLVRDAWDISDEQ